MNFLNQRLDATPATAPSINQMGLGAIYDSYYKRSINGEPQSVSKSLRLDFIYPGTRRLFTEITLSYYDPAGNIIGDAWEGGWSKAGELMSQGKIPLIDFDKLKLVAEKYPKNAIVSLDLYENLPDIKSANNVVEDKIRYLRKIIFTLNTVRPDLIIGYYCVLFNWWDVNNYRYSKDVSEGKYDAGPANNWWKSNLNYHTTNFNNSLTAFKRLDYGLNSAGSKVPNNGLNDALNIFTPALYPIYGTENDETPITLLADTYQIDEALKQLLPYGKPVIPFMSTMSYTGNMKPLKMSDKRVENSMKAFRDCGASGVIIFGDGDFGEYEQNIFNIGLDYFGKYTSPVK